MNRVMGSPNPTKGTPLDAVHFAHTLPVRGLTSIQVARRWTSHTVAAISSADRASSQPLSMN